MTFANGHPSTQLGLLTLAELHIKDRVISGITHHA